MVSALIDLLKLLNSTIDKEKQSK